MKVTVKQVMNVLENVKQGHAHGEQYMFDELMIDVEAYLMEEKVTNFHVLSDAILQYLLDSFSPWNWKMKIENLEFFLTFKQVKMKPGSHFVLVKKAITQNLKSGYSVDFEIEELGNLKYKISIDENDN